MIFQNNDQDGLDFKEVQFFFFSLSFFCKSTILQIARMCFHFVVITREYYIYINIKMP